MPDPQSPQGELAEFGYKQELDRSIGKFASFAAGVSYISILTGTFQLFYFGFAFDSPEEVDAWHAAGIAAGGTAIGRDAYVYGAGVNATAVGLNAWANGASSVALGAGSRATEANVVSVGNGTGRAGSALKC